MPISFCDNYKNVWRVRSLFGSTKGINGIYFRSVKALQEPVYGHKNWIVNSCVRTPNFQGAYSMGFVFFKFKLLSFIFVNCFNSAIILASCFNKFHSYINILDQYYNPHSKYNQQNKQAISERKSNQSKIQTGKFESVNFKFSVWPKCEWKLFE